MRTPIGKISKPSLLLLAAVVGAIVAGLLIPGPTGTVIEVVGWLALAGIVIMEVGFLIVPKARLQGRRPPPPDAAPATPVIKSPRKRGLSHAAEWSRTITGVSTHKALNPAMNRLLERKTAYGAKSIPVVSGWFRY